MLHIRDLKKKLSSYLINKLLLLHFFACFRLTSRDIIRHPATFVDFLQNFRHKPENSIKPANAGSLAGSGRFSSRKIKGKRSRLYAAVSSNCELYSSA